MKLVFLVLIFMLVLYMVLFYVYSVPVTKSNQELEKTSTNKEIHSETPPKIVSEQPTSHVRSSKIVSNFESETSIDDSYSTSESSDEETPLLYFGDTPSSDISIDISFIENSEQTPIIDFDDNKKNSKKHNEDDSTFKLKVK